MVRNIKIRKNMKRIQNICLTFIIIGLILWCCYGWHIKILIENDYGVEIKGGLPLIDYRLYYGDNTDDIGDRIRIYNSGMTVTGKPKKPIRIYCDARELIIEEFCSEIRGVELCISEESSLIIKGWNKLDKIKSFESLSIKGDKSSEIDVCDGVYSDADLTVSNVSLISGKFDAEKNIRIQDDSCVNLRMNDADNDSAEVMYSSGMIVFELSEQGQVSLEGRNLYMSALGGISFGRNNVIVQPENGKIRQSSADESDGNIYHTYDRDGKQIDKAVIRNTGEK